MFINEKEAFNYFIKNAYGEITGRLKKNDLITNGNNLVPNNN